MPLRYAAWARFAAGAVVTAAGSGTALPGCSCGDGAMAGDGSGTESDGGSRQDAAGLPDAATPLIWIDFSLTGCAPGGGSGSAGGNDAGADLPDAGADGGPGAETCHGSAPLRLSFVPIAPAPVDLYEWNFGDGTEPDRRPSPDHVYAAPGLYDVSLVAQGLGGTAAVTKPALVAVSPGTLGSACAEDGQCASGLCVCGAEPCAGLASGFCSAPCSAQNPCAEGVCADLAPTPPPEPAAWQTSLCLRDCSGEERACPEGQVCRELRRTGGTGWIEACFSPGLLRDIGAPCMDQNGVFQDALCASGLCQDNQGLRGTCTAPCADQPCPPSAACATFNQPPPGSICLARCGGDTQCDSDPWLACEAAGHPGARGFTVSETPSPAGYCAPESCDGPEDCPLGQCTNGFCGPGP